MELNMNEFEEIALELRRRKKINMWGIDISLLEDGVYRGNITAPQDIKEFKGFKEEFKLGINEVSGYLSFFRCTSLTSVGVLPQNINGYLIFYECESLTSVGVLPQNINGRLDFSRCESLTSVEQFPKVVNGGIYTDNIPFFENMNVEQIREKYGIKHECI